MPVPAVIVVPAESVVFADTDPADAVIFPVVAVNPAVAVINCVDVNDPLFVVVIPVAPIFTDVDVDVPNDKAPDDVIVGV